MALLFGSIAALDLRLAGLGRGLALVPLARLLRPIALGGFALAVAAGLLLFATDARAYWASDLFRLKMLAILLAGVNLAAFSRRQRQAADERSLAVFGILSIALWLSVIVLGRLIGYF